MDAAKWRIKKRRGKWCVFAPRAIYIAMYEADNYGETVLAFLILRRANVVTRMRPFANQETRR
jgi:hypothetical protein